MRRTTRRNRTVEARIIEAAFTATHDLCCRTGRAALRLAVTAWCYSVLLAGVTCGLAGLCWQQVHADDRRELARLPGLIPPALAWLWAALVAAQSPLCRLVRAAHDAILAELDRSEGRVARRERAWLRQNPDEAEDGEDLDELWIDTGNPVGRAA